MKHLFSICLIALLSVAAYSQTMFEITMQQALAGDSKAQNNIAAYYKEGYYVKQDCNQAVYWYRKLAQQNATVGMYGLGQCYATGCSVQQNLQTAANYILAAAQKGLKEAQRTISYMYEKGIGVTQNRNTAQYWYNKANQ